MTPVAAIVDGYSSGAEYVKIFHERGVGCVHIQSAEKMPKIVKKLLHEEQYTQRLVYQGSVEKLTQHLAPLEVQCIIAGSETGVELADLLSEERGLLNTNSTALSLARRDKFFMAHALKKVGLPTPQFSKVSDWEELLKWKEGQKVNFPIVLKPLRSAGTDGVYICKDSEELRASFLKLQGSTDVLGNVNSQILVQSFLTGTEFLVNSVSKNGEICIISIHQSQKKYVPGKGYVYDLEKLKKITGMAQACLIEMHKKVVSAVGIKYGPAHGEYMYSTEKGAILIEIAARPPGGFNRGALNACTGYNLMDLSIDAYIDPSKFDLVASKPYERKQSFYQIELSSDSVGVIRNIETFTAKIKKLASFYALHLNVSEGVQVLPTQDLLSSLGAVFLVHPEKLVIKADYERVHALARRWLISHAPALAEEVH